MVLCQAMESNSFEASLGWSGFFNIGFGVSGFFTIGFGGSGFGGCKGGEPWVGGAKGCGSHGLNNELSARGGLLLVRGADCTNIGTAIGMIGEMTGGD